MSEVHDSACENETANDCELNAVNVNFLLPYSRIKRGSNELYHLICFNK